MRRLLRCTFHALAAASLLLCVATAAVWVRSYSVFDEFVAQRLEASEYARIHGGVPGRSDQAIQPPNRPR